MADAAPRIISLTTDFGLDDGYVGALKAALLRRAPGATIVDNSHTVPPGDVAAGAFLLEYALLSFPPGTVHLGVVDPGVGTDRDILAMEIEGGFVVGPGNGLLDRCRRGRTAWAVRVDSGRDAAPTFESRDVMAPVVAALAMGAGLEGLGAPYELAALPVPAQLGRGHQETTVAHVDHYGTVVLDIHAPVEWAGGGGSLSVNGAAVGMGRTFGDVGHGHLVAYRGSIGYLEVAEREGRATDRLGLSRGEAVQLDWV